jgi:hypothetical protein
LGAEVGGGWMLGGVVSFGTLGVGELGTLAIGRLIMALGSFPSAKAAVVLDIHGYCEGLEPLGNVGGGLEE